MQADAYSIYISGENAYASISDSSIKGPAIFWTQGGRYHVEITPVTGGNSLTAVVLLPALCPR